MKTPRWARRLTDEGDDPDPRFSFANERTFLAWIRTSLALVAAGIGVDAFATDLPGWGRRSLAAALVVLGGLLSVTAFRRWFSSELALRRAESLPANRLGPVLSYALGAAALLGLVLVFIDR